MRCTARASLAIEHHFVADRSVTHVAQSDEDETFVPHIGWLRHETGDDVGRYLREGWFEFAEQALWWLLLRPGDRVIDCGAHVGLFTLIASQAVGEYGRVIALEPNPVTAALLRRNIEAIDARNVEIVEAAASTRTGTIILNAGAGESSAYSSSVVSVAGASEIKVRAMALDDLIEQRDLAPIMLLKLDVEGAEVDAWRSLSRAIKARQIGLAMVEFTEANQRAAGLTSVDVARELKECGYPLHRFNPTTLLLEPAAVEGPIEYENLYASCDVAVINGRLREAAPQRRRIANEILSRGAAAFALLKRACDCEHFQQRVGELQRRLNELVSRDNRLELELADTRERLHTYAAYIDRVVNSRTGRLARSLHLANMPGWIDMVNRDLSAHEQSQSQRQARTGAC